MKKYTKVRIENKPKKIDELLLQKYTRKDNLQNEYPGRCLPFPLMFKQVCVLKTVGKN